MSFYHVEYVPYTHKRKLNNHFLLECAKTSAHLHSRPGMIVVPMYTETGLSGYISLSIAEWARCLRL